MRSSRGTVVILIAVVLACGWSLAAQAATITVTTAGDEVIPNDGSVSLREAIAAINAGNNLGDPDITAQNPGTFGVNDAINFNIPGGGPFAILVGNNASALNISLPSLAKPVLINTVSPQQVYLDGTHAGAGANGLTLAGGNGRINGLSFGHWSGAGIYVSSSNNFITGNFIGTDFGGAVPTANANGIAVASGSSNTIGGTTVAARNLISGNTLDGIVISSSGGGTTVSGNFIGTTLAGTGSLPNGGDGILLSSGSPSNYVGGLIAGAGNVISGNIADGVLVTDPGTTSNLIAGNFIGTDVSGSTPLFNGSSGIDLAAGATGNAFLGNTIGSGTFPINMNSLANHDADNSFFAPPGVSNFVIGAINPATLALGSPATSGSSVNVPFTIANGIAGDELFTTLYRAQCGTWSTANPVSDDSLMLSGSGGGSGTFTFPAPLPGGTLFGGGDGNTSATNLSNPCSVLNAGPLPIPIKSPGGPGGTGTIFSPLDVVGNPINGDIKMQISQDGGLTWTEVNSNTTTDTFVNSPWVMGFEGARGSAITAKHKRSKKAQKFALKTVAVTLAPGQKTTIHAPLTAKAKAYLKRDKAKTVTITLTVTATDPAGNRKTFTRTLTVKLPKKKTKKH
jgi:trimeric autotransporter adhesin